MATKNKKDNYNGTEFPEMTPEEIQEQVARTQALTRSLDENPEVWDELLKRVQSENQTVGLPASQDMETEEDGVLEESRRRWKVRHPQRGRTEQGSKVRSKN